MCKNHLFVILSLFTTSLLYAEVPDFNAADANKDGIVSEQEFVNFITAVTALPPASQYDDQTIFNKADLNKDGAVSPEELALYTKQNTPDTKTASRQIVNKTVSETLTAAGYKSPTSIIANQSGTKLFVACRDAGEIAVVDTAENKIVKTFPVGNELSGLALSSEGKTIYATFGGHQGQVAALNSETGERIKTAAAAHTPTAPVLTPNSKRLFICNRFNAEVAEYELPALKLVRTIKVIREPVAAAMTLDGKYLLVLNALPKTVNCDPVHPQTTVTVAAEVSVIDVIRGTVKSIALPNGSCNLNSICLSPDGRYAYLTHLVSHFMNSTDKLDYGQMNVNAVSILDTTLLDDSGGYVNTILLDDPKLGAANPWGITMSADGKKIFVTAAGTNELIILDAEALHKNLASAGNVSNDLSFTDNFKMRIPFKGKGARAVAAVGQSVYICLYFSDRLVKYDFVKETEPETVLLNQNLLLTPERVGEMAWNDATLCFQQWQSCASCHPEARMTGMNWDLLHDGSGNPKNTKSMVLSYDTPPAMWLGDRFSVRRCTRTGFEFIMFAPPLSEPCDCIDDYLRVLQPVPSPYLVNGNLSEKAQRGKVLFESSPTGCSRCHPAPLYSDKKMYNVHTQVPAYESRGKFDTPTLVEVWRTTPYLHDGRYVEMKDVFTKGKHGNVEHLSDEQLDDLVEYVLSL
jgi:DNA-binding beta-propeller fold protein YncE